MKKALSLVFVFVLLLGMMSIKIFAIDNDINPWEDRSAVFVGDSITAGSGTTKIYFEYLAERLGLSSVTPMGVGGSCISAASNYGQSNQPLINRYQNIPSADLIVVFMGTNDYGHETPLGSVNDTQDGTFYGALNTIVPELVSNHTSSKVVFVTPLHRYGFGTSNILGTKYTYDSVPNGVGATLGDYAEAITTVCANNDVPVIDLYAEYILDPSDAVIRTEYMPDGLHPNAVGHEVIAGIMESHIRRLDPVKQEPVVLTEIVFGNRFAPGNNQACRASSRINYYLKAGTIITLKDPSAMQWACTKTSDETSSSNLGYFPDSAWSDKETAVVAADGWIGFTFKYRDETQSFDLTKPLSDYITIHTHSYNSTVTAPTCTEQGYTTYTCACGDSYVADYVDTVGHTYKNGICTGCGEKLSFESMSLRYDDHLDMSGKTVEIIDAGTPTSYQVGYGVEENAVLDTAVVTLEGDTLVATGIGTATVKVDGETYEITVTAAPISLLLLIGQSNMRGSEGNAAQSIVCPEGMVYATYGDDRGADNTAMTVSNATHYAPSALTGRYSNINVAGTTDCLNGYPVYSLTEAGAGKIGPDSGFAYEWVQQTGEKVWIVNAAHGGTNITAWQPGTTEYEECQALFTACQETLRKEIAAGHFTLSHMAYFWCQGCTNRTNTAQWYVEKYLTMHEGLLSELSFDHDSNPETANKAFEFGGIIPVRVGSTTACYRDGTYSISNPYAYHESFVDLRFSGPRVAQYWMINNPELTDIWGVCNIGEDWVWMPDGTNGVTDYFQAHYPGGTVDYTTQVQQSASFYTPTTPNAVHDSIHYNQIGYNEIGRESVRNALIMLGEIAAPDVETTVELLSWDGYTPVEQITASTAGNSGTLVVPKVYPIWKSKDITYEQSEGLTWDYYDLLAADVQTEGTLTAGGQTVCVAKAEPGAHYADHLSQLPADICCGLNLWPLLEHESEFYYGGTHWAIHGTKDVRSVTIPVIPGDKVFATSFGKAGENGDASTSGIRVTFFSAYGVAKTMAPAETYAEFSANGGYLIAPENAIAINVAMWNNSDENELYLLDRAHDTDSGICGICGKDSHIHSWSGWQMKEIPGKGEAVTEERFCSGCGETETREVESVWQKYDLAAHYSDLPENVCNGLNLWNILEHDKYYFANGTNWSIYSGGTVKSVTISVEPGDVIFATAWGKAGENGHATADGIRVSFFDVYGVAKTMTPAECYAEFFKNGGYLIAPEGAIAVNVAMWNNSDDNEIYILNREHTYTPTITAPTCTEQGYTTYTCECGDSYVADEIPAFGHTEIVYSAVEPSCTATGLTEGKKCSACGEITLAQEIISALGHTPIVDAAVEPTCTESGLTEGSHCDVCGEILIAQTSVPVKGHSFGDWYETKAPTEAESGEKRRDCADCEHYETATIATLNHSHDRWEQITLEAVEPTCTTTGLTEGKKCSACGEITLAQEIISALGHTPIVDAAVEPTCTESGLTEGSHCDVCGEILIAQTSVPVKGHSFGDWYETKAPTEAESGEKRRDCADCEHYETATIATLNHSHDRWEQITLEAVEPTCTTTGLTEGKKCSACGEITLAQEIISALGHTPIVDAAVEPTCTKSGLTEGSHCDVCGEILVIQASIPANGHSFDDGVITKEPTEEETGIRTFTCDTCGEEKAEVIPSLSHIHRYESIITAPNCKEQGYTTNICACGDSYIDTYVEATGHAFGAWAVSCVPTCTEKGEEIRICANCDLGERREIAAKGHDYKAVVTAPTCTEDGYTTHSCSCGDTYVDGSTSALGHTHSDWIVDTEPAVGVNGSRHIECTACKEVLQNELIEALPEGEPQAAVKPDGSATNEGLAFQATVIAITLVLLFPAWRKLLKKKRRK